MAVVAAAGRREAVPAPVTVEPAGKVAVTPAGKPVAARETVWLNPLIDVTFKVYMPVAPGATVTVEGVGWSPKSGGAAGPTTKGRARGWVTSYDPLAPVTLAVQVPGAQLVVLMVNEVSAGAVGETVTAAGGGIPVPPPGTTISSWGKYTYCPFKLVVTWMGKVT